MKTLIALLILQPAAFPQTIPAPAASALNAVTLPTIAGFGGSYNQFIGGNLWVSGIFPASNAAGVYVAATTDLFPVWTSLNGKSGYVFQTSARGSVHKVLWNLGSNMGLFGVGGGYAFGQAANTAQTVSGISADVTFTWVHYLNKAKTFALVVPIRALYMPAPIAGWNPLVQAGFAYTTGASK